MCVTAGTHVQSRLRSKMSNFRTHRWQRPSAAFLRHFRNSSKATVMLAAKCFRCSSVFGCNRNRVAKIANRSPSILSVAGLGKPGSGHRAARFRPLDHESKHAFYTLALSGLYVDSRAIEQRKRRTRWQYRSKPFTVLCEIS